MEEITLKQWTINFVKNKDLLKKELVDYEEKDSTIIFNFKNGVHRYLIVEIMNDEIFSFLKEKGFKSIVCFANKKNLDFLIANWKVFSEVENFFIIFADVKNHDKWMINPRVHSHICDDSSLIVGLKSMYDNSFKP
ncbi:MAG: hypothetical protein ABH828_02655 [archaeon]